MLNDLVNKSTGIHFMTQDEKKQLKKTLIEIYKDLSEVCKKYDIRLLACGGTALGSARHKGFIPWDDDMDLGMPREDYNKFKEIFEREMGEKYILSCPNYINKPTTRFMKVYKKGTTMIEMGEEGTDHPMNVFVDIFPIENVPDNKLKRYFIGNICNMIMFIVSKVQMYEEKSEKEYEFRCITKESLKLYKLEIFIGHIFSFMTFEKWVNILEKIFIKTKKGKYCSIPTGRKHYFGEMLKWDDMLPPAHGEFEGMEIMLPNKVDKYLSQLYGDDYMQPPPENKRERHFIIKFDLNREPERN
jgi:lipopolysaccharide cholinephosphotransferase